MLGVEFITCERGFSLAQTAGLSPVRGCKEGEPNRSGKNIGGVGLEFRGGEGSLARYFLTRHAQKCIYE